MAGAPRDHAADVEEGEEEAIVGSWRFPGGSYSVVRGADGLLWLSEGTDSASCLLSKESGWFRGELRGGDVRLRAGAEAGTVTCCLRDFGCEDWGEELVALPGEGPADAPDIAAAAGSDDAPAEGGGGAAEGGGGPATQAAEGEPSPSPSAAAAEDPGASVEKAAAAGAASDEAVDEDVDLHMRFPPGFGIARAQDTGVASHELIYEHHYSPKPVRAYRPPDADEGCGVLRPAVRNGRVAFRFWGVRVALSADHARSWMGHIFLQELHWSRLRRVELLVRSRRSPTLLAPLPAAAPASPRSPGGTSPPAAAAGAPPPPPAPTWLWHVWPAGCPLDAADRVEVAMAIAPAEGMAIRLSGAPAARQQVYAVLRQYCDDGGTDWRPLPEPPAAISKIKDRHIPASLMLQRKVGKPTPESAAKVLDRSLEQIHTAETRLWRILCRGKTVLETAKSTELIPYVHELKQGLQDANTAGLRVKREWTEVAGSILDGLLRRLHDLQDTEQLVEAQACVYELGAFGVVCKHPDLLARLM